MMLVGPRDRAVHQGLVASVEEPVEKRLGRDRVRAQLGPVSRVREAAIRAPGPTTGLWRSTACHLFPGRIPLYSTTIRS